MTGMKSALFFTVFAQQSVQVISLVSVVVLARLLTPAEVGVYAIASSIALLAIELRSLGVGQFLVREVEINEDKIRRSIGVMVLISWGLGAIIAISAPFVDDFYNEPALSTLLWIIAISFLLSPFASVPYALLSREMKFKQIFFVKFGSNFILTATSIVLVVLDFSYYGLAIGLLAGSVSEFLIIQYFTPKGTPWKPSFKNMGQLIQFGMLVSVAQLFTRFSESISDLVIGRAGTMTDVGLFSRGLGLILFINKIIVQAAGPVVLPYLSSINRAGQSVSEAYLKVISLQSAFSLPVLIVVHVAAFPIIRLMFGDQWDAAIPIASALAIWAMLQAVHSFSDTALVALGAEKLMFVTSLVIFAVRIALVIFASFYFGEFRLINVAWALVLSGVIEIVLKTLAIKLGVGAGVFGMYRRLIPSLLTTLLCWLAAECIDYFVGYNTEEPWISFLYTALVMPLVWLASLRVTRHEVWAIILTYIPSFLKRPDP